MFCAQHDIDTGDANPIKQPPRRPPISARDAEDDILDEMLQVGVIAPSMSPWSSPVCMVKKKDDTYRFCIDYRRLSDVTKKDAYPVPDVKDALDSLRGAKYFATIDLLSGYWQLGLTPRARERSAFCTRRGLFEFTRMPFGLSNAPSTFCRLMHIILFDYLYKICICYLDDIIVYADSPEQLIERLDAVFTRLREKGLKAKPSKCVLFNHQLSFWVIWFRPMALNPSLISWIPSRIGPRLIACVMCVHSMVLLVIIVDLSMILPILQSLCHGSLRRTSRLFGPKRPKIPLISSSQLCALLKLLFTRIQSYRAFWTRMPRM